MSKRIKEVYNITDLVKDEIVVYCYEVFNSINKQYLVDNTIYENEFLELLFQHCEKLYKISGNFELTKEDVVYIIYAKRKIDLICEELENDSAKLIGVNKENELIFEFKDKESLNNFNHLKKNKNGK